MNRIQFVRQAIAAIVLIAAVAPAIGWASHPYHVSNAEVNFNPKTGNLEVALCVWPTDLEQAIGTDPAKKIDLDKTDGLDELMHAYLKKTFLVRSTAALKDLQKKPTAAPIRWVGHERNLKSAWLYFEIECEKSTTEWTIENRVFFELNDDQLNQLELSVGGKKDIVVCRNQDPRFSINTTIEKRIKTLSTKR
ncbi:MAG: hypothetical protein ACI814_005028 [Mariniblastus sp.]|jgi:hypothetical protein